MKKKELLNLSRFSFYNHIIKKGKKYYYPFDFFKGLKGIFFLDNTKNYFKNNINKNYLLYKSFSNLYLNKNNINVDYFYSKTNDYKNNFYLYFNLYIKYKFKKTKFVFLNKFFIDEKKIYSAILKNI